MENNQSAEKLELLKQVFLFFVCWFSGALFGTLLMQTVAHLLNIGDWQNLIKEIQQGKFLDQINSIKIISLAGHFSVYTLSALSFAYLIKKNDLFKFLNLNKSPGLLNSFLSVVLMISAYPIALWIAYINTSLLPSHLIAEDTLIFELRMMTMTSVTDLILNIFLLGIIAGLGEELLFRGIIQRFAAKYTNNLHIAVWITAILFSFIHFQPEGFIPRFLLGALLGYLFVWSGSLWLPVIAHISFNSVQVFLFYFISDASKIETVNQKPDFSLIFTFLSSGIFIFVCFVLWKINKTKQLQLVKLD